ncbi:MAG: hypothetical protein AAFP02_11150 [Bacteroidota bacterium]
MPRIPSVIAIILLAGFCLLETLCSTRWVYKSSSEALLLVTIPYFILGLLIALWPLLPTSKRVSFGSSHRGFVWPFTGLIGATIGYYFFELWTHSKEIIAKYAIDYHVADMLPVIQKQAERFLNNGPVYDIIPEIWGGMPPIYFPAFWAPFTLPMILGYDIRWATVFLLLGSMLIACAPVLRLRRTHFLFFLPLIPMYFIMEAIWVEKVFMVRLTQEGVAVFYYLLLGFAIWRRIPWLEGIAIGLCLLSRYALIPWLLVYGVYALFFRSRRELITVVGIPSAMVLFLFLIPYGFERWDFFFNHPGKYKAYAERLWIKDVLFYERTLGLAKYFSQEMVIWQNRLHLGLTFAAPAAMLAAGWKRLRKPIEYPQLHAFFLLCSLKLSLVMFYNFIVVPVYYLFYVNTFLSVLIVAAYIRYQTDKSLTHAPAN